jgi:organic hydroperoxide reductase OsmC/OhrA
VKISARVESRSGEHHVVLSTNGAAHGIDIPPKASGPGSSANGGELLFLALATCYCNDIYREAAKREIVVHEVEVSVDGQFGGPGEPARELTYRAKVVADASEDEIRELMRHTDTVAEIQNTLRTATPVTLGEIEAVTAKS